MHGVYLPVSSGPNTFVNALSATNARQLFSSREKKVVIGLSCFAFILPLAVSIFILRKTQPEQALRIDANQVAKIAPGQILGGNDDLAMAEIFLQKAGENLTDPQASQQYLSQAQSLLSLNTQSGPKVDDLNQRLAALTSPASGNVPSTAYHLPSTTIAAAADAISSISAQTQSNAVSNSVTMKAGTTSLLVPYTALLPDTQIYLTIPENRNNATLYVSQKEAGKGFTLASVGQLVQDTKVVWYEIKSQ